MSKPSGIAKATSTLSRVRRQLISSITRSIAATGLEWYESGICDGLFTGKRLELLELPEPLRFKLPIPDGNEDEAGRVEIQHITRYGYVEDSHGGGVMCAVWQQIPVENLVKFARVFATLPVKIREMNAFLAKHGPKPHTD